MTRSPVRPWMGALAIDVAAVLIFATAGRRSHDDGTGLVQLGGVAAPFLIGLAVAWALVPSVRRDPLSWRSGMAVWVATIVLGLALRRLAWDRGVALSFVIVTALVLGALIVGWRALWAIGEPRRTIRS